ncbi:hypothetical protein [Rhodopirellula islandica]|nr:hypothetical protein [Rhodopirellula islandica]
MVDPGLPTSPALYFDAERGEAYVSTRVVDWRAVERGYQLTRLVLPLMHLGVLFWVWNALPSARGLTGEDVIVWGAIGLFGYMIVSLVTSPLIWYFMPRCFSGLFFSKRLTFLFTSNAIGFRSWFYSNGVRITRRFRGRPTQIKIAIRSDLEAESYSEYVSTTRPGGQPRIWPKCHFRHARKLEFVIVGGSGNTPQLHPSGPHRLRTLPVATLPLTQGESLTVVLNAAISLTQPETDAGRHFLGNIAMDLDLSQMSRR